MALSKEQRKTVFIRANHNCEYCKTPEQYSGLALEIDHIKPQSANGTDSLDNICAACRTCNKYKHDFLTGIDPETDQEQSLYNPRSEKWSDHFLWSDNGIYILGKSSTGRATIARLEMNNRLVITAREMWRKAGWIPPQD
jgi:hypothetical protein